MNTKTAARSFALPALLCVSCLFAGGARAEAFESLERLDQDEFVELAEHLAAATHYKAVTPAEALGVIGFDVGVEISSTEIDRALFDRASGDDFGADSLLVPRLHAHKGLPFGIDIGASVGAVAETDLTVLGAELRVALLEGGVATPAIGLRASYSQATGLDELELENAALELTVSKGFLMFTPYAGIGYVRGDATPNDADALEEATSELEKFFAGVNVNFVGLNVTVEADRTGDYTTFSAKLGLRL